MSRASLAIATGSREVIRADICVFNSLGNRCFSTNAMDLAERWARDNVSRGPFTIERVQEVRLRTVLATICGPEREPEAAVQGVAVSSTGSR
jgi:hypothetical protein